LKPSTASEEYEDILSLTIVINLIFSAKSMDLVVGSYPAAPVEDEAEVQLSRNEMTSKLDDE
jgi:hypothetical protein